MAGATGSFTEYAAHRGCTPGHITRLRQAGRLVLIQQGKKQVVDFEASDRRVDATAARDTEERPGRTPADERVAGIYRQSQAQHKAYAAKTLELQYRKLAGELIDRTQAQKAVFDAFNDLRNALLRLPKRQSGLVTGMADPREVEKVLERELRAVLERFARSTTEALQA